MRLLKHSAGDTIVEVLIAMAVASSVLGGAYVVVNRTMANTRQSQEHTEALQIANQQIESIGLLAKSDTPSSLFSDVVTVHCASSVDGSLIEMPGVTALPAAETAYPTACKGLGTNGFYRTAFIYVKADNNFKVYVNWLGATGKTTPDEVTITYKVYK